MYCRSQPPRPGWICCLPLHSTAAAVWLGAVAGYLELGLYLLDARPGALLSIVHYLDTGKV
jgi:hypothetical protein